MIHKIDQLTERQLKEVKEIIGEAFVSNNFFKDLGPVNKRREDVLEYMNYFVDYVYESHQLYVNDDFTGFIGIEDSKKAPFFPQMKMLLKLYFKYDSNKLRKLITFSNEVGNANQKYTKMHHLTVLMIAIKKEEQGKGKARELIKYAMHLSDEKHIPLVVDTEMERYSKIYEHLGCKLYNTVTASNGVSRYCLVYKKDNR